MGQLAQNSGISAKPKGKPRGRPFKKGQSGNPGGMTKDRAAFLAAVRSHVPEAVECLLNEIRTAGDGRVTAATRILEWGLGKPAAAPEDRDAVVLGAGLQALATDEIVAAVKKLNDPKDDSE